MTDLKSYYDCQLAQVDSIIEESIRIESKPIKLIAKLLPMMKHHICTIYSASQDYYGGESNQIAGTG